MVGTFLPNLGTLGFWVLELFAMYATVGRTDGQRNRRTKAALIAPFLRAGHKKLQYHCPHMPENYIVP